MITVRFSKNQELVLPASLGRSLGLQPGDRVQVQRQGRVLQIRRLARASASGPLTELAHIITSARPVGSVDVERYMDWHGYEQI